MLNFALQNSSSPATHPQGRGCASSLTVQLLQDQTPQRGKKNILSWVYLGELGNFFLSILAEFQPSLDISSQGKLEIKRGGRARGAREKDSLTQLEPSPSNQSGRPHRWRGFTLTLYATISWGLVDQLYDKTQTYLVRRTLK